MVGTKCDRCQAGFYGDLNDVSNKGCSPCSCRSGFSYSSDCRQRSGQCDCVPHTYGKQCEHIENGFYCARFDHILFEAENTAIKLDHEFQLTEGRYHRNESEFSSNSEPQKWTGSGYMKVYYGDSVKFSFQHLHKMGFYDLVLRYDVRNEYQTCSDGYDWELGVKIVGLNETELEKFNTSCAYTRRYAANREIWIKFDKCNRRSLL